MVIVLTMDEVKEILEGCIADVEGLYRLPKLPGSQLRHIDKGWRDYLNKIGMTIAEYNNKIDTLNGKCEQVAIELKDELLLLDDPDEIFNYTKKISMKLQQDRWERRKRDRLEVFNDKEYLRQISANYFAMVLGVESNSRKMGYKDHKALCDFRNLD